MTWLKEISIYKTPRTLGGFKPFRPTHQIGSFFFFFFFYKRLAAAWSQAGCSAKYTDILGVEGQHLIIHRLFEMPGNDSSTSMAFGHNVSGLWSGRQKIKAGKHLTSEILKKKKQSLPIAYSLVKIVLKSACNLPAVAAHVPHPHYEGIGEEDEETEPCSFWFIYHCLFPSCSCRSCI